MTNSTQTGNSPIHPRSRFVVFAREPLLGEVKSRLAVEIGPSEALAVYREMLARIAGLLERSKLAWDLYVNSNIHHEKFLSICNKRNIYLQNGEDLGAKMLHAIEQTLGRDGVEHALVIGSDCPALSADYLQQALNVLESGVDVVLGPAEDGGYVLIGMARPIPAIFESIPWGSDLVLERTIAALEAHRLSYKLLDTLWDVDRPEDLARLSQLVPEFRWSR